MFATTPHGSRSPIEIADCDLQAIINATFMVFLVATVQWKQEKENVATLPCWSNDMELIRMGGLWHRWFSLLQKLTSDNYQKWLNSYYYNMWNISEVMHCLIWLLLQKPMLRMQ